MFQPFEKFKTEYISRLLLLNKRYLVSQTYKNALNHFDEENRTNILLSDYDDIGLAELHRKAVRQDKYAALMDLKDEKIQAKLRSMLAGSQYNLFWAVVMKRDETKKNLDMKYKDHIRRWIAQNTTWRVGEKETIGTSLEVTYGEFYLVIKRGSQMVRPKFEDIEKS